jgi:periplasmic protein TonB
MLSCRALRYYVVVSILFHMVIAALASLVPSTPRTAGDVMVVDLADLPRSTDFLRPRPGIIQGGRPSPPPPPRAPEPTPKIPERALAGRVPDLPVNPDLPPEKEFPASPPGPADLAPAAGPGGAEETAARSAERLEERSAPPPPSGSPEAAKSLRELTPSLGEMVLARTEPEAGRGRDTSSGSAVGTGGNASEEGAIVEERGGGARLTSLNAPEIQYISYFAGIKRKVELVWQYPFEAQMAGIQGDLVLDFVIARDGALASVSLIRGSGHKALDEEAIGAIRKAAPYDPIPARYAIPELRIRAHFIYEMHALRIR